jgi:hypothetical protein
MFSISSRQRKSPVGGHTTSKYALRISWERVNHPPLSWKHRRVDLPNTHPQNRNRRWPYLRPQEEEQAGRAKNTPCLHFCTCIPSKACYTPFVWRSCAWFFEIVSVAHDERAEPEIERGSAYWRLSWRATGLAAAAAPC